MFPFKDLGKPLNLKVINFVWLLKEDVHIGKLPNDVRPTLYANNVVPSSHKDNWL